MTDTRSTPLPTVSRIDNLRRRLTGRPVVTGYSRAYGVGTVRAHYPAPTAPRVRNPR